MLKAIFLYPLSLIYAFVVGFRNVLFDFGILKHKEFDIPVISVGNLTVGGTGKTPHVEYITSLLKDKFKVAVLSRGYKRKTKGFILADENSNAGTIGDELFQIKRKFPNIIVAASEKRVSGIKKLLQLKEKPEVIILDDAFQHRYVKPGLSLLLIDYTKPFFKEKYLPYGRLREGIGNRDRASMIIVTKVPFDMKPIDMRIMAKKLKLFPYQSLHFSSIEYQKLSAVYKSEHHLIDEQIIKDEQYSVLLITGIANPSPMKKYLAKLSDKIVHLRYKDHHNFTSSDIKDIEDEFLRIKNPKKVIITTEKDAVKFIDTEFSDKTIKSKLYYLPIKPVILNNEKEILEKQLLTFISKDKTSYKLSSTRRFYT